MPGRLQVVIVVKTLVCLTMLALWAWGIAAFFTHMRRDPHPLRGGFWAAMGSLFGLWSSAFLWAFLQATATTMHALLSTMSELMLASALLVVIALMGPGWVMMAIFAIIGGAIGHVYYKRQCKRAKRTTPSP